MKQKNKKLFYVAIGILVAFALWTTAMGCIDVQKIGPRETSVGFAAINSFVYNQTGVNMTLYTITDWLGLVPFGFVIGFGILGLVQWIKRKHFLKVDRDILVLGGFYLVVMAAYIFFEMFTVNYRPVLINGSLETSYPSSTTMLVMCVIPTAMMQLRSRMKDGLIKTCILCLLLGFLLFMVIGRMLSGVHWITDIIGGALLSTGLVLLYRWLTT